MPITILPRIASTIDCILSNIIVLQYIISSMLLAANNHTPPHCNHTYYSALQVKSMLQAVTPYCQHIPYHTAISCCHTISYISMLLAANNHTPPPLPLQNIAYYKCILLRHNISQCNKVCCWKLYRWEGGSSVPNKIILCSV